MPLRIGIAKYTENDFPSCNISKPKLFISPLTKFYNDGCGPLVRRETVALEKGVRFSPVVLNEVKATRTEGSSVVLCENFGKNFASKEEKMKILFICKYNRFRSQIAEQFFKKYNSNKNLSAKSAGLLKGRYPLDKDEVEVVRKFEIIIDKKPETVSVDELIKTDLVIIVANDVPRKTFNYEGRYVQKVIVWKISDEFKGDKKNIRKIVGKIKLKIKELIKELENKK